MLAYLVLLLTAVLGSAGFGIIVRALPWPKSWLTKKPLACPACMSGWGGFAVIGLWLVGGVTEPAALWIVLWFTAIGGAAPIYKSVYPPEIVLNVEP